MSGENTGPHREKFTSERSPSYCSYSMYTYLKFIDQCFINNFGFDMLTARPREMTQRVNNRGTSLKI